MCPDSTFSIRPVREEDEAGIVTLLNPIIQAGRYTVMETPFTAQEQLNFIRSFPELGVYLAAICNRSRRVLGIQDVMPVPASAGARVGEISTFVALDSQRQGIGWALCRATFRAVGELNYHTLRATVRADNPLAQAFYTSQGFRPVGSLQGGPVERVVMERSLDQD